MLTLWPSNCEDLWETTHKLRWSLFPTGCHLLNQSCFQGQPVNFLILLSWLLSLSIKSSHNRLHSHFTSVYLILGVSPVALFLVYKSKHSSENNYKTFPANSCSWIFSLSLPCLYLSCIPVLLWVRVAILWSFVLPFESSDLTLYTNLNPHAFDLLTVKSSDAIKKPTTFKVHGS